jgi:hypothetical protein
MFLTATLNLNPSAPTEYAVGDTAESELLEHETFSAGQILQQLVLSFRDIGITDASVLSHDGNTVFHDEAGNADDLTEAMKSYARLTTSDQRDSFETLRLVLEHEGTLLKVVLDARVDRVHEVDVHPIEIRLAGFLRAFSTENDFSDELQQVFDAVFESQAGYDDVCDAAREEFTELLERLEAAAQKRMKPDAVECDVEQCIILATEDAVTSSSNWSQLFDHSCIRIDDVRYCYMWHQRCATSNIELSRCKVIGTDGTIRRAVRGKTVRTTDHATSPLAETGDRGGGCCNKETPNPLRDVAAPDIQASGVLGIFGPSKREVWKALADTIGAEYPENDWMSDLIIYRWNGHEIQLHTKRGGLGSSLVEDVVDEGIDWLLGFDDNYRNQSDWTTMTTDADPHGCVALRLWRTNLVGKISSAFGTQDIQTGDPSFDEAFKIRGNDEKAIREFLSDDRLRALIALQPDIMLSIGKDISFQCAGVLKDPYRLVRLFELFVELLIKFEQRGRESKR